MAQLDSTKPINLTAHSSGTGPLRKERPIYQDLLPPCNRACPAGENIQSWLAFAQSGNYFEAFQALVVDNPFPAIMGRVCVKPCESSCNRTQLDTTVNIHAVERFIGDEAIKENWKINHEATSSGKRVLIIGSGPSGLSAAYHLARAGHSVEIFEAGEALGGLLRTGVPEYRLPKSILDAEIIRLLNMGINVRLNYKVTDVLKEKTDGKFDAVYLGIGAQLINSDVFQTTETATVTDAFSFFKDTVSNPDKYTNKKVAIYGGGKLALYLARIIKRYNSEAVVLFPGDRNQMPAFDYETEDALAEGVEVQLLKSIAKIEKNVLTIEKMKVERNKAVGTGEYETIEADALIVAMGQQGDTNFLRSVPGMVLKEDGTVVINQDRMTGHEGIFAGGDILPDEKRSATIAIGHGKKAAKYIDSYLRSERYVKPEKSQSASYSKLNLWFKTEAPQKEQNKLTPAVAIKSFDEVIVGLSEKAARFEAQRCLSCGNCFECDGCFAACPEDAILKLGPGKRYEFIYDKCTGCGVCFEQCPCHAIDMIPEPSKP